MSHAMFNFDYKVNLLDLFIFGIFLVIISLIHVIGITDIVVALLFIYAFMAAAMIICLCILQRVKMMHIFSVNLNFHENNPMHLL